MHFCNNETSLKDSKPRMMSRELALVLASWLALLALPPVSRAEVIECTNSCVTDDAGVWAVQPSNNYGDRTSFGVGYESPLGLWESYLRFDVACCPIPPDATIETVELTMRAITVHLPEPFTIFLREASTTWNEETITHQNRPTGGDPIGVEDLDASRRVTFDVTDVFTAWWNGTAPNHGFRMTAATNVAYFASKENNGQDDLKPKLLITYSNSSPDLTVLSVSIDEASICTNGTVTIQAEIANLGAADSGAFDLYPFLTSDYEYDPNDSDNVPLETQYESSLGPSETRMVTLTVPVPPIGPSAGYYAAVFIDHEEDVEESNEENNIGLSDDQVEVQASPSAPTDEMSDIPGTIYAYGGHTARANYYDPDGPGDIRYCDLKLQHPNAEDIAFRYDTILEEVTITSGAAFVIAKECEAGPTADQSGIHARWGYVISRDWMSDSGIKHCIQTTDHDGCASGWQSNPESSEFRHPAHGVSVLVHGYDLIPGSPEDYWSEDNQIIQSLMEVFGGGEIYVYQPTTGDFGYLDGNLGLPRVPYQNGGQIIIVHDWKDASNGDESGTAEAAAEALFAALLSHDIPGLPTYDPLLGSGPPTHFIGHSRGTSVSSEVIQRLTAYGITVDYFTSLDPHDFNEEFIPYDHHFHDPSVQVWGGDDGVDTGTIYADNYWQSNTVWLIPSGRSLGHLEQNSYEYNFWLNGRDGFPGDMPLPSGSEDRGDGPENSHTRVIRWYRGTMVPAESDGANWYEFGLSTGFRRWLSEGGYGRASRSPGIVNAVDPVSLDRLLPWPEPSGDDGDRDYDSPNFFNGNFDLSDLDDSNPAGWTFFGGGGEGRHEGGRLLIETDAQYPESARRRHNRFLLPPDVAVISFDVEVVIEGVGHTLQATLRNSVGDELTLWNSALSDVPPTVEFEGPFSAAFAGRSCTLELRIGHLDPEVESRVFVDNVRVLRENDVPKTTITQPNTGGWFSGLASIVATAESGSYEVTSVEFEYSLDQLSWLALPGPDSPDGIDSDGIDGWGLRFDTVDTPNHGTINDGAVWVRARSVDVHDRIGLWDECDVPFGVDNEVPTFSTWSNTVDAVPGTYWMIQSIADSGSGVRDDEGMPAFYYRWDNPQIDETHFSGLLDGALHGDAYRAEFQVTEEQVGQHLYWRVFATDEGGNTGWSEVHDGGVILDDDVLGPTYSNFADSEDEVPGPYEFYVTIQDPSGVRDDSDDPRVYFDFDTMDVDESDEWVDLEHIGNDAYLAATTVSTEHVGEVIYWRVLAWDEDDTPESSWSEVQLGGEILAAQSPSVETQPASDVTDSVATLNGGVNPNGQTTTYYFEYGTDTAYGSSTDPVNLGSGSDPVDVNEVVSGLSATTEYHFRLVAENAAGMGVGEDESFVTLEATPQACCLPDDSCQDLSPSDCEQQEGTPQGEGTTCATTDCSSTVACCYDDLCEIVPESECEMTGGYPVGDSCDPNPCLGTLVCSDGSGEYPTVQAAVDAAVDGESIWLCDGIYTGPGNRAIRVEGKSVAIRSTSGDRTACIIDCEGADRGFHFVGSPSSGSVLSGITIRDGWTGDHGGGIACDASSPTLENLRIEGCGAAFSSGAIYLSGASPTISDAELSGNRAKNGGAIYCYQSSNAHLTNVRFEGNWTTAAPGRGGGLISYDSQPVLIDVVFCDNEAMIGGAIYVHETGAVSIANSTIAANTTASGGSAVHLGGSGGASITIDHSILVFGVGGNAVDCDSGAGGASLTCTDVFGNDGGNGDWVGCIAGMEGSGGNLGADPQFCDLAACDLTLDAASPCAAENNPTCGQIGAEPVGCGFPVACCLEDGSCVLLAEAECLAQGGVPSGDSCAPDPCTVVHVVCPDGAGDFGTIAAAVLAAEDGEVIELCDGDFTGDGNRSIWIEGKSVTIRSQSGDPDACRIVCGSAGRAFSIIGAAASETVMEGFSIVEGRIEGHGGAIYLLESSPTLRNLVIQDCEAVGLSGGAIHCNQSSPHVEKVMLRGNRAKNAGGIYCYLNSHATLDGVVFEGNATTEAPGLGGGLMIYDSIVTLANSTFASNRAMLGGGIYCHIQGTLDATNVTLVGNLSTEGASGIHIAQSGGVPFDVNVDRSILAFGVGGEAVSCVGSLANVVISCSDVFGNAFGAGDWTGCLAGFESQNGNANVNPEFCDLTTRDYGLSGGSWCAEGNNPCGQVGAWTVACSEAANAEEPSIAAAALTLAPPRPNPSSSTVEIEFSVPADRPDEWVTVAVFGPGGRVVRSLYRQTATAGRHIVAWDGADQDGRLVPAGLYFCRVTLGEETQSRQVVRIR